MAEANRLGVKSRDSFVLVSGCERNSLQTNSDVTLARLITFPAIVVNPNKFDP